MPQYASRSARVQRLLNSNCLYKNAPALPWFCLVTIINLVFVGLLRARAAKLCHVANLPSDVSFCTLDTCWQEFAGHVLFRKGTSCVTCNIFMD